MPECGLADGCRQPDLCPLNQLKAGASGRIKHLAASPEDSTRLRELGFCEDQEVKLVSRHANVICQICNARLGISAQLAGSILVEPIFPPPRQFVLA
jgi:Fe2+ transport system protein FeoA